MSDVNGILVNTDRRIFTCQMILTAYQSAKYVSIFCTQYQKTTKKIVKKRTTKENRLRFMLIPLVAVYTIVGH